MIRIVWHALKYAIVCKALGHKWQHMDNLHTVCPRCTTLKEWD